MPWEGTWAVPEGVDLLVNATPLGLFPDVTAVPDIDMDAGTIVADVILNPPGRRSLLPRRAVD